MAYCPWLMFHLDDPPFHHPYFVDGNGSLLIMDHHGMNHVIHYHYDPKTISMINIHETNELCIQ